MVNGSQNAAQFGQVAMKRSVRFTIRLRARVTVAGGYHAGRRERVQLLPVDSTRLGASLECPCTFAFPDAVQHTPCSKTVGALTDSRLSRPASRRRSHCTRNLDRQLLLQ